MLENLAYCLNATAPIFLLMLLGLVFRRLGFFSQAFADKLNDFVFKVGLPVMLFKDLVESDFFTVWDNIFYSNIKIFQRDTPYFSFGYFLVPVLGSPLDFNLLFKSLNASISVSI